MFIHDIYFFTPSIWPDINGDLDDLRVNKFYLSIMLYSEDSVLFFQKSILDKLSPYFFEPPCDRVFSYETLEEASRRILWTHARIWDFQLKGILMHFDMHWEHEIERNRIIVVWGILGLKNTWPLIVSGKFSYGVLISQKEIADFELFHPFGFVLDLFWFGGRCPSMLSYTLLKGPNNVKSVNVAVLFRKDKSDQVFLIPSKDSDIYILPTLPSYNFIDDFVLEKLIEQHWGFLNCCEAAFLDVLTINGIRTAIFVVTEGGNENRIIDYFNGIFVPAKGAVLLNFWPLSPLAKWACMAFNNRFSIRVDYSIKADKISSDFRYS